MGRLSFERGNASVCRNHVSRGRLLRGHYGANRLYLVYHNEITMPDL